MNIQGHEIEGHDGHNVAVHESKTTGIPHIVCHDCKESLLKLQPCEVYSRVCGYLRPVGGWNFGKKAEFKERVTYKGLSGNIQGIVEKGTTNDPK